MAHGPSCSAACGIFPDQGSNPCPLHWQADSQPLRHQERPRKESFDRPSLGSCTCPPFGWRPKRLYLIWMVKFEGYLYTQKWDDLFGIQIHTFLWGVHSLSHKLWWNGTPWICAIQLLWKADLQYLLLSFYVIWILLQGECILVLSVLTGARAACGSSPWQMPTLDNEPHTGKMAEPRNKEKKEPDGLYTLGPVMLEGTSIPSLFKI